MSFSFNSYNKSNSDIVNLKSKSAKNKKFKVVSGIVYSNNEKVLYKYPADKKAFKISKKVTKVGDGACINCNFKTAKLPSKVTTIGAEGYEIEVVAKDLKGNILARETEKIVATAPSDEIKKKFANYDTESGEEKVLYKMRAYKTVDGKVVYTQWSGYTRLAVPWGI